MTRWYAITEPQHNTLPAVGDRAFGTSLPTNDRSNSKPATREAPTSA